MLKTLKNQQASLLIDHTVGLDNPLTGLRVTLQGDITKSDAGLDRQRFINRHPSATDYADFSDFSFYTFAIKRAHIVAGFGHIHWVKNIHIRFDPINFGALADAEADILAHMNTSHSAAVNLFAQLASMEQGPCVMTGIDLEGADLRAGRQVARLTFDKPIYDAESAHLTLAKLAKQAREHSV